MRAQATFFKKWTQLCLLILVGFALSSCGGGRDFDTPAPIVDTQEPRVESFFPSDDFSDNFEVDFDVEIIFSELMNQQSLVNEGGIKLYSGKSDLDSEFDIEERAANISFSVVPVVTDDLVTGKEIISPATKVILTHESGRFALNTDYSIITDFPARDLVEDDLSTEEDERNFIAAMNVIDFTTEQGEWKASKDIPNIIVENKGMVDEALVEVSENQFSPKLIANAKGDTYLIWRQELSSGVSQLWVSRYLTEAKEWSLEDISDVSCSSDNCANSYLISEISNTSVIEFDAAINDQGHLAIVWSQASDIGEFVSIWATLFDGKAWTSISEINSTGLFQLGHAESPSIALDSDGNAISVWREHNGQYSRIKANIFKLGLGGLISNGQWVEAPIFIDSHSQVISKNPTVSMNSNGLGVAIWEQSSSNQFQIYSNHIRLNQSNDWIGVERIDTISSTNPEFGVGNSSLPSIAVDENNDAIAVWLKHDGQRNNVWFNRFTGSWGELADKLEESRLGDASYPNIKIGKNNRALAYWIQENNSGNERSLFTSFFSAFTGWEQGRLIATDNLLSKPEANFDREGNAVIIWQEGLTKGDINTRYYSKLTDNWNNEETIDKNGSELTLTPLLEDGRFLAAWIEDINSQYRLKSVLFSD